MSEDIFNGCGIEVTLNNPDDFLKVKETLQRIGVASKKSNVLWQSCHILHKRGRYIICSFKELFLLDGKDADISDNDLDRRNTITKLLQDWGLVTVLNQEELQYQAPMSQIKVIPFKERNQWELRSKYTIGKKATQKG